MSESCLSILCHIINGEVIIKVGVLAVSQCNTVFEFRVLRFVVFLVIHQIIYFSNNFVKARSILIRFGTHVL